MIERVNGIRMTLTDRTWSFILLVKLHKLYLDKTDCSRCFISILIGTKFGSFYPLGILKFVSRPAAKIDDQKKSLILGVEK